MIDSYVADCIKEKASNGLMTAEEGIAFLLEQLTHSESQAKTEYLTAIGTIKALQTKCTDMKVKGLAFSTIFKKIIADEADHIASLQKFAGMVIGSGTPKPESGSYEE